MIIFSIIWMINGVQTLHLNRYFKNIYLGRSLLIHLPLRVTMHHELLQYVSRWWPQLIWKISQIRSFPQVVGAKIKTSNHHQSFLAGFKVVKCAPQTFWYTQMHGREIVADSFANLWGKLPDISTQLWTQYGWTRTNLWNHHLKN